jgi:hypothetical protein
MMQPAEWMEVVMVEEFCDVRLSRTTPRERACKLSVLVCPFKFQVPFVCFSILTQCLRKDAYLAAGFDRSENGDNGCATEKEEQQHDHEVVSPHPGP